MRLTSGAMARAVYRVRQFGWAVRARISPTERWEVARLLNEKELVLFDQMDPPAQYHSLKVFAALRGQDCDDEEVLVAALLHDVGKRHLGLFFRVAAVLIGAVWPGGLRRLASPQQQSWRFGFYTYLHHAAVGAAMLQRAGTAPEIVDLVKRHHSAGATDRWLKLLQLADEQN